MPEPPDTANPAEHDTLGSLHKMSRTAGLGSQDYVAVNVTSVVTLMLGLASSLAFLLGPILLFIPVVALIVGFVSIRQVRRSAGTQTGVGLAILGMVIAMLFVGLVGGKEVMQRREVAREQGQIISLLESLGQNVRNGSYDDAWEQFTPRFHERFKKEHFIATWERAQGNQLYGKVKSIHWNGYLEIGPSAETGTKTAYGLIIIETDAKRSMRQNGVFRKLDGKWLVEDMEFDFSAPTVSPQQPG